MPSRKVPVAISRGGLGGESAIAKAMKGGEKGGSVSELGEQVVWESRGKMERVAGVHDEAKGRGFSGM